VKQAAHYSVCNESLWSTVPFKDLATVVGTWCNVRWQTDKALTDTWQGPSDVSTDYGLEGLGSNSGRVGIFHISSDWLWGAPCLLYKVHRVSFLGIKRAERGAVLNSTIWRFTAMKTTNFMHEVSICHLRFTSFLYEPLESTCATQWGTNFYLLDADKWGFSLAENILLHCKY